MKLSSHYSKTLLITASFVLLLAGIAYYTAISYITNNELDRDLTEEIDEIKGYIKLHNHLPDPVDFDEDQTTFIKTNKSHFDRRFFDTTYTDPKEKNSESGRAVEGLISLNGQNYRVIIAESKESTEYLTQIISIITVALMVLLFAVMAISNRFILRGLWKPFYQILGQLKAFNIATIDKIDVGDTRVDEFTELNQAVMLMSSKVRTDYQNLKVFTENASHEMLTPIALITSKLDTLIQDETLSEEQFEHLNGIFADVSRLSKLNQALLLLAKIDNKLIHEITDIDLRQLIEEKLLQFNELLQNKKLEINADLHDEHIQASRHLIEIMLNNLFSNAIRHNQSGGTITIVLDKGKLIFSNTGQEKSLDPEEVFERFKKAKTSEGSGLGLTIVKNICLQYGYAISYSFEVPRTHAFTITFAQK